VSGDLLITSLAEFLAQLSRQPPTGARYEAAAPGVEAGELRAARGTVAILGPGAPPPAEFDVLLVVGAGPELARSLVELAPHRIQLLPLPCSAAAAERAAAEACAAARAIAGAAVADKLVEIGMALSAERDPGRVLQLMLEHAQRITHADAGSIYLVEEGGKRLRFKVARNASVTADFSEFSVPVTERSVVGTCVLTGQVVNIPDLYVAPRALGREFHHDRSFDERFGYQTRSMLTTPMRPPGGDVLGVIQLINAKRGPGPLAGDDFVERVVPFTAEDERLCGALAAQGAVALDNAHLYAEIQQLFEGFVRASVHAIEQRDPTTSGHSQRVADLTVALARAVDGCAEGGLAAVRFSTEDLREIEYAGLLHDFGKVGVREEVLVKAKKLSPMKLDAVLGRVEHMRAMLHVRLLERQLERSRSGRHDDDDLRAEFEAECRQVDDILHVLLEANEPSVTLVDEVGRLHEIARMEFRDTRHRRVRLLDDEDVTALLVRRGSLTEAERAEIQSHVTHTYNFLVRIPWGKALARVPEIAGKHHEYLDGSGYPHRVGNPEIPVQTRMMTISDIFDALTASDRPYKKAVPVPRALDILAYEVRSGKVDATLFDLFVRARIFETIGLTT
jgi:HD-GYP domain-containing protein (c-di-GMP phosphodiesterase class II)